MPTFDPNAAAGGDSGVFGLPYGEDESALIIVPVPWEATTSYGGGAAQGPAAILAASRQVDLFDLDVLRPYEPGLFMRPIPDDLLALNDRAKALAQRVIAVGGDIGDDAELRLALDEVNQLSEVVNQRVDDEVSRVLDAGKIPAVLGGDHSVPLGAWRALARRVPSFGVLHIDAHLDLRDAYEGFQYSHASILRNGLNEVPAITRLVQVGMRDVGEDEVRFAGSQGERVRVFFDRELARRRFVGEPWVRVARLIVDALPEQVWVTFDIDGLDPKLCPNTGTPVPGGLELAEANFLLGEVVRSGRKILGFDLNEVAPAADGRDEWDANVGARALYKLCAWTLASQGKAPLR